MVPFLPQPMLEFPARSPPQDDSGKVLRPLAAGSLVWIQLKPGANWKKGCVRAKRSDRSYLVELPGGRSYVRNRRFLRPLADVPARDEPEPEAVVAPEEPVDIGVHEEEPEAVVAPEEPEHAPRRSSRRTAGLRSENAPLHGSRI